MNQNLELQQGIAIIDAIKRLNQLQTAKIVTKNDDAERAGLEKFISSSVLQHASVLLGCWYAVKTEYEPLIGAFAHLQARAAAVMGMRVAQQQHDTAEGVAPK